MCDDVIPANAGIHSMFTAKIGFCDDLSNDVSQFFVFVIFL